MSVLDLTDSNFITIISAEDEEPGISKYLIQDSEIFIEQYQKRLVFKIKQLGLDELKLILNIDFQIDENKSINGDIRELTFELYE